MIQITGVPLAVSSLAVMLLVMAAEMLVSRAHERTLRAQGAVEPRDDVYRTMQWVYPGAFVAMGIEGALLGPAPDWRIAAGLALLLVAKGLKYWAIATLGTRWTFRVLVPPGAQRIRRGPYRAVSHPNYVAVLGEIVAFAVLVGAPIAGVASTVWFGVLIRSRVRVEEQALRLG